MELAAAVRRETHRAKLLAVRAAQNKILAAAQLERARWTHARLARSARTAKMVKASLAQSTAVLKFPHRKAR